MTAAATCLLVLSLAAAGLAAPSEAPKRSLGLRTLFISCLDAGSQDEDSSGDFMSCLNTRVRESGGELRLLPGVTLSAENVDMSGNGQRAMSGNALKIALPWSETSARFFGGWNNPSLVLSGGESELDIGVEVDKEDQNAVATAGDEESGRGKKLKKVLIPLMIGLKLKSALISMLSYGAVIAMAAKALLLSIVAVAIAGIGAMRRMYKDYSDATVHSYSSYEPSSYSSSYHHRSYNTPMGPAVAPSNQVASVVSADATAQPNYAAHDMTYAGYRQ